MKQYDGYLFDLDGTIYLGEELIPGADRTVAKLRERRPTAVPANKRSRGAGLRVEAHKLGSLHPADVVNSPLASQRGLRSTPAGA